VLMIIQQFSKNVGQDFIVLDFFVGGDRPGGKGVCGRLMSPAHETQSMREIRLLLTVCALYVCLCDYEIKYNKILTYILRSIFLEIPHLELPR
jgi:hypothetical protein